MKHNADFPVVGEMPSRNAVYEDPCIPGWSRKARAVLLIVATLLTVFIVYRFLGGWFDLAAGNRMSLFLRFAM